MSLLSVFPYRIHVSANGLIVKFGIAGSNCYFYFVLQVAGCCAGFYGEQCQGKFQTNRNWGFFFRKMVNANRVLTLC